MAKGAYIGINGAARKVKKGYIGVDGAARKIRKAYLGVGGAARPCWSGGTPTYYGTVTPMAYTRGQHSGVSFAEKAVFADGNDITTMDIYDKDLTRSNHAERKIARFRVASTTLDHYALFSGGFTANWWHTGNVISTVEAFDESFTSHSAPNMSVVMAGHGGGSLGDICLFAAGYTQGSSATPTANVDAYNDELTKTVCAALSNAHEDAVGAVGDHFIIHCCDTAQVVDTYDRDLTKKSISTSLTGTFGSKPMTIGHHALFCGRQASNAMQKTCVAYDENLTRTSLTDLSVGRIRSATFVLKGHAFIAGGLTANSATAVSNAVDIYDDSLTRTTGTPISSSRWWGEGAVVGDFGLVGGGILSDDTYVTTVDAYTFV